MKDRVFAFPFLLLLCVSPNQVNSASKTWRSNTNYNNPNNWNVGRLPCARDVIKFGESSPSIALSSSITVNQLVLPRNGEFLLGDGFALHTPAPNDDVTVTTEASQIDDNACGKAEFVEFNRTTANDWFDPRNWEEFNITNSK